MAWVPHSHCYRRHHLIQTAQYAKSYNYKCITKNVTEMPLLEAGEGGEEMKIQRIHSDSQVLICQNSQEEKDNTKIISQLEGKCGLQMRFREEQVGIWNNSTRSQAAKATLF